MGAQNITAITARAKGVTRNGFMTTSDEAETVELLSEALEIIVGECTNFNLGVSAQYIAYNSKYDIPPSYNGIDFIRVR